jgi:hypothetical protein
MISGFRKGRRFAILVRKAVNAWRRDRDMARP